MLYILSGMSNTPCMRAAGCLGELPVGGCHGAAGGERRKRGLWLGLLMRIVSIYLVHEVGSGLQDTAHVRLYPVIDRPIIRGKLLLEHVLCVGTSVSNALWMPFEHIEHACRQKRPLQAPTWQDDDVANDAGASAPAAAASLVKRYRYHPIS